MLDDHRDAVLDLLSLPNRSGSDVQDFACRHGVSLATVYRWMTRLHGEQSGAERGRPHRQDRGRSRLGDQAEAALQSALQRVQQGEIGVDAAYAELRESLGDGKGCPSRATFYRRWRALNSP